MTRILLLLQDSLSGAAYRDKLKRVVCLLSAARPCSFYVYTKGNTEAVKDLFAGNIGYELTDSLQDINTAAAADLCLFDTPSLLSKARKFSGTIPVIYLQLSAEQDHQLTDYAAISHIFYFEKKHISALPSRISRKCVYINPLIQFPSGSMQLNDSSTKQAVYIPSPLDTNLNITRHVCYYFNMAFNTRLTVLANKKIAGLLRNEVNDNITLEDENLPLQAIKPDVVIADGLNAMKFMAEGVPVIIVGLYGIGGLVGKVNYLQQFNDGCYGRPGSFYNEYIPLKILQYDLDLVFNNSKTVRQEALLIADTLREKSNGFIKDFDRTIDHLTRQKDPQKMMVFLEPDIDIIAPKNDKTDQFVLQRKNGYMLTFIEKTEAPLFRQLKKGVTFHDLKNKLGYDEENLQSYFEELLRAEAIYYTY